MRRTGIVDRLIERIDRERQTSGSDAYARRNAKLTGAG
jgi:hypothetical protein